MPSAPSGSLRAPALRVDHAAIAHNVRLFRERIAGAFIAVLKADGFGHGAGRQLADLAIDHGADALATATLDEAVALREAGVEAPLLSWLPFLDQDADAAVEQRIEVAASSTEQLAALARAAARRRRVAAVHLHVDAGMHRGGADPARWDALVALAADTEHIGAIRVVGVMGHLSTAREPGSPQNAIEIARFAEAVARVEHAGLRPRVRHLAATDATLGIPSAAFTGARIGGGLYGIGDAAAGLRTALALEAPVVEVRDAPAGAGVGYGLAHRTPTATRLALLPLGYADGIPLRLGADASVLVAGRRAPIVGEVSMDQVVVDVGDAPVHRGDSAVVLGDAESGAPTLADWARWAGTSQREVAVRFGVRAHRVSRVAVTVPAREVEATR